MATLLKNVYVSMTRDGYEALEKLLSSKKAIDLIISLPKDKSQDVSDYVDFSELAERYSIPIWYTTDINSYGDYFSKNQPRLIIVNGWSKLLKSPIINSATSGCVGLHPALLPKNRGRAPIAWHFINNEEFGGVSLFYIEETCDSGPIIAQERFPIDAEDNASSFYKKMTSIACELLLKHFDDIESGKAKTYAIKQNETAASYLLKRVPSDSYIDFDKLGSIEIVNLIRAVTDIYPLAFFSWKGNKLMTKKGLSSTIGYKYSGKPGQIAKITNKSIIVITRDGLVELTEIVDEQKNEYNVKNFREGGMLNDA